MVLFSSQLKQATYFRFSRGSNILLRLLGRTQIKNFFLIVKDNQTVDELEYILEGTKPYSVTIATWKINKNNAADTGSRRTEQSLFLQASVK